MRRLFRLYLYAYPVTLFLSKVSDYSNIVWDSQFFLQNAVFIGLKSCEGSFRNIRESVFEAIIK